MDEKMETTGNIYAYTNWRGKTFLIDQRVAESMKKDMMETSGDSEEDVAYLTPEWLIKWLPDMEACQRYDQLLEMWEMPEAKTDR
ncbi:MAG TPA: hypothetical protein VJ746_10775 [Nitrospira sp.]|nr:hypothetical protein [Nitrospira sp.]